MEKSYKLCFNRLLSSWLEINVYLSAYFRSIFTRRWVTEIAIYNGVISWLEWHIKLWVTNMWANILHRLPYAHEYTVCRRRRELSRGQPQLLHGRALGHSLTLHTSHQTRWHAMLRAPSQVAPTFSGIVGLDRWDFQNLPSSTLGTF